MGSWSVRETLNIRQSERSLLSGGMFANAALASSMTDARPRWVSSTLATLIAARHHTTEKKSPVINATTRRNRQRRGKQEGGPYADSPPHRVRTRYASRASPQPCCVFSSRRFKARFKLRAWGW